MKNIRVYNFRYQMQAILPGSYLRTLTVTCQTYICRSAYISVYIVGPAVSVRAHMSVWMHFQVSISKTRPHLPIACSSPCGCLLMMPPSFYQLNLKSQFLLARHFLLPGPNSLNYIDSSPLFRPVFNLSTDNIHGRALLYIVGCLTASQAPTHWMPVAPLPLCPAKLRQSKSLPTLPSKLRAEN